jgi:hypothetical protein
VIESIDHLHDIDLRDPQSKAGMLPVVRMTGASPVKSGASTNYKPSFEIVQWLARPAAMTAGATVAQPVAAAPAPVAAAQSGGGFTTGASVPTVTAPAMAAAPAPAFVPQPAPAPTPLGFG